MVATAPVEEELSRIAVTVQAAKDNLKTGTSGILWESKSGEPSTMSLFRRGEFSYDRLKDIICGGPKKQGIHSMVQFIHGVLEDTSYSFACDENAKLYKNPPSLNVVATQLIQKVH